MATTEACRKITSAAGSDKRDDARALRGPFRRASGRHRRSGRGGGNRGAGEAAGQGRVDLGGLSAPTETVTGRSRRSLSGSRSRAGRRTTAGLSMFTALATRVAATSAVAASRASVVTASAMPSEKERPRAPEVAMPPMPEPASRRRLPLRTGTEPREKSPATPMSSAWPGVTSTAMSPPSLTKARSSGAAAVMCASSSSATAPATAAIGVTNTSAKGRQASTMRRATGLSTRGSSAHRRAQRAKLVAQLRQDARESARTRPRRRRARPSAGPRPSAPRRSAHATGAGGRPSGCWMTGAANIEISRSW